MALQIVPYISKHVHNSSKIKYSSGGVIYDLDSHGRIFTECLLTIFNNNFLDADNARKFPATKNSDSSPIATLHFWAKFTILYTIV